LQKIRLSIKGIVTELPLDIDQINEFFKQQIRDGRVSKNVWELVLGLANDLASAQNSVSDDLSIEFVIPDPDKSA
jgi:hypothetical protein